MKSRTTERFRKAFAELPAHVQRQARSAYLLFQSNSEHPSLRFKRVHASRDIVSVRVGLGFRALGVQDSDTVIWFWIGAHADYDRLIGDI